MAKPSVRTAQLISPFGVGSLCEVDGQSFFVRDTGAWPRGKNLVPVKLTSLGRRLRPLKMMRPVESVAVTRFPRWHFCPSCREMVRWTYQLDEAGRTDDGLPRPACRGSGCNGARLVPMRFVAVCDNGHLDEIDWYGWAHRRHQQAVHGSCNARSAKLKFVVSGKSGGDFSSMRIECDCGASGSLEGIADGPLPQRCDGYHPGIGRGQCIDPTDAQGGPAKLFMEPRGSSALHYASVISALDIAVDEGANRFAELRDDDTYKHLLNTARLLVGMNLGMDQVATATQAGIAARAQALGIDEATAWGCFSEDLGCADDARSSEEEGSSDFTQSSILGEEFPVLSDPGGHSTRWLITRPSPPPRRHGLEGLLERVVQVERLREVRAFRGFQRRDITASHPLIEPWMGKPGQDWLPAIQVLGEGIFLQFSREAIARWLAENAKEVSEFTHAHLEAAEAHGLPSRMGFNATPTFIMAHTFSHLLVNQLSFDCGYSSTSLRERVYCGPASNPYAAVMIYTADSDAEGSMGGLVEMGAPDRIADVVYRAIARSQWCSGDPVCRELDAQGLDGLNRAACHACSLVAETSCMFANMLLDRVLVSGDGRTNGRGRREPVGFFHPLLAG